MPSPVDRITIHHQGGGAPTDDVEADDYTYWIGTTRWTLIQDVWSSYGTKNFNGESVDVCLSGTRGNTDPERDPPWPVTDNDLALIAGAIADARARGYVIDAPQVVAHRNSPGSSTACPGDNAMARWSEIVDACVNGAPVTPIKKGGGAVEIVNTPSGNGYYIVDSTGAVFAYGDAKYHGGANTEKLNAPIVGMCVRPQNDGYWLLASDGGVFAYGKAAFKGAPTGKVH